MCRSVRSRWCLGLYFIRLTPSHTLFALSRKRSPFYSATCGDGVFECTEAGNVLDHFMQHEACTNACDDLQCCTTGTGETGEQTPLDEGPVCVLNMFQLDVVGLFDAVSSSLSPPPCLRNRPFFCSSMPRFFVHRRRKHPVLREFALCLPRQRVRRSTVLHPRNG